MVFSQTIVRHHSLPPPFSLSLSLLITVLLVGTSHIAPRFTKFGNENIHVRCSTTMSPAVTSQQQLLTASHSPTGLVYDGIPTATVYDGIPQRWHPHGHPPRWFGALQAVCARCSSLRTFLSCSLRCLLPTIRRQPMSCCCAASCARLCGSLPRSHAIRSSSSLTMLLSTCRVPAVLHAAVIALMFSRLKSSKVKLECLLP